MMTKEEYQAHINSDEYKQWKASFKCYPCRDTGILEIDPALFCPLQSGETFEDILKINKMPCFHCQ